MSYEAGPRARHIPLPDLPDGFFCPHGCRKIDEKTGQDIGPQPLEVQRTVHSAPGLVTRYRRCPKCQHAETTWEQRRPSTAPLQVK